MAPSLWAGSCQMSHLCSNPASKMTLRTIYRPIALTSTVCKVLERAVADGINDHVSSYCLGNIDQQGFTARKSCVTQLTNAIYEWASIIDKPCLPRIDIAFLDFSKAFDIMPHHTLLNTLARNFNIQGQTWLWLKSFLTGRHQRVMYHSWSPFILVPCYIRRPPRKCAGPFNV